MVNGRTGKVQGERPYSWIKITLAILAFALLVALILFVTQGEKVSMHGWENPECVYAALKWNAGKNYVTSILQHWPFFGRS
jgi:uncharacterized membrane protein